MMLSVEYKVRQKLIFFNQIGIVNDLKNGVSYVGSDGMYTQYSGMKGYVYVFEQFLLGFANTRPNTYAYNIVQQQFNVQGTTMYDTLATYHTAYSASTVCFK